MPDERLITEIESLLQQVVELGAEKERTRLGPNLLVTNSAPTGLDGYILVRDDRDGDNILALKVPGVIYNTNDLVNVLFVRGGEAIAFQQGSDSDSNGIWGIVAGTSTDIFYNDGDVGIGKAVAPDARLEILDATQSQLRLTYTEDTTFVDFTLNASHDLTIKPSSTGQIILQPTTDSVDFFQVLDADGGTPILNVDSTSEAISFRTTTNSMVQQGTTFQSDLYIQGQDVTDVRTFMLARFSDTPVRAAQMSFLRAASGEAAVSDGDRVGELFFTGHDGTDFNQSAVIRAEVDGTVSANTVPMRLIFQTSGTNSGGLGERLRITSAGDIGVNAQSPAAQLHVDQSSTTAAKPVLYLDQADVSEEMIEFNTTIGTGNAIEAVGAKTLTTTHFIKVTLPGSLTRYIPVGTIA